MGRAGGASPGVGVGGLALAFVMVASLPARGDDPSDRNLDDDLSLSALLDAPGQVWTATKSEQKVSEAPAIITTVTRDQIAIWGYRSLSEVLSHLLGFYIVDDHTSANVAVRGISGGLYADSSIVKLLIDGRSVAFQSTGGNALGPELVPLSAVERIEIVRGPGSALFGADAFLGVINVLTRSGKSLSGGTAWLGAGRAGEKLATDVDLSAGFEYGPFDVMAAVRRQSQDLSGLLLPATSPAPSVPAFSRESRESHGMDEQSLTALARVTYRRGDTELGLFGYFSSVRRGDEFGSLVQLASGHDEEGIFSENRASQSQMRVGLTWDQAFSEQLQLTVRGAAFRGAPGDDNRTEVGSAYYYVTKRSGFRGGELEAQLEWKPPSVPLRLVVGGSAFVDDELLPSRIGVSKQASDADPAGTVIEAISVYQDRKMFLNNGAYLQGIWTALSSVSLTGGLRYDRHNIYGNQVSSRLGLVLNPLPNLHAKLLYGSAFKAPSPVLLYAVPSAIGDVIGNPQLKPQYVHTGEFQISWDPREYLTLSSDVAYSVLSDKTEFVQQGISKVARNVARATTVSWESLAELKYRTFARLHASLELQRTVRSSGEPGYSYSSNVVGSTVGIYPNMMVHAGLAAQPPGMPLRGAIQVSFIGARRPSDNNILLNAGAYELPPYTLLEAGLSTVGFDLFGRRGREVSFALTGKNLLGTTGPTPGFSGVDYPLAPRTFFLQMNVTL
jgi:outer membrane receptor for ferrienterochelin and colicins